MSNKRLDEIEIIKDEIPEIKITPTFGQAMVISVAFFGLAIFVTYLAEAM